MDNDALLEHLGTALAAADPVPRSHLTIAHQLFTWRTLGPELSDLLRTDADRAPTATE